MTERFRNHVHLVSGNVVTEDGFQVALENMACGTGALIPKKETAYESGTPFKSGDVLFGKLRPYLAKVWLSDRDGFAIGDIHVYRPRNDVWPAFLKYVVLDTQFIRRVDSATVGAKMPRAEWSDIREIEVEFPSLVKQRAIADFLDRETAQIDAMVEAQTNLVSLLNERLASATNRSVLGLDGEPMVGVSHSERVRYAPRGLPHLATELALNGVPDHWSVYRFKNCVDRMERRNEMEAADLMSLTSQGLVVPRTETGDRQQPAPESVPRYLLVAPGDLVVNPMWLIGGAVGVSTREGAVSPDYRVFSIDTDRIEPRYLHHLLRSTPYRHQYTLFARANTTFDRRIQQADLDNLAIPVPPLAEQRRIAQTIDETMRQGDALIQAANTTVGLLRERRDALITAAVTGRIDPTTGIERIDPTTEREAS